MWQKWLDLKVLILFGPLAKPNKREDMAMKLSWVQS
jgi:hypothetical protein